MMSDLKPCKNMSNEIASGITKTISFFFGGVNSKLQKVHVCVLYCTVLYCIAKLQWRIMHSVIISALFSKPVLSLAHDCWKLTLPLEQAAAIVVTL